MSLNDIAVFLSHRPYLLHPPARLLSNRGGVVGYNTSSGRRSFIWVFPLIFFGLCNSSSLVPAHFIIGLVWIDRTVTVLFPLLETRWEYLHAGKGVVSAGQGSDTLYDTTGLEGRGQTRWIFECISITEQHILTF